MPRKQVSKTGSKKTSKKKKAVFSSSPNSEKIRERAYFIWETKGYPNNSELNDWLEAERELTV